MTRETDREPSSTGASERRGEGPNLARAADHLREILETIDEHAGGLERAHPARSQVHADARVILEATRRASRMVRQLTAHPGPLPPERFDVRALVTDLQKVLQRLVGEAIALTVETSDDPCWVCADPSRLERAVMNLALNARDAMPDGGLLAVRAARVDLDPTDAAPLDLSPGPYVRLTVHDTGPGMPPDVAARAFEPHFTTKPDRRGTGLGLSTVLEVVQEHRGAVDLTSAPDAGATFDLYLPAVDAPG